MLTTTHDQTTDGTIVNAATQPELHALFKENDAANDYISKINVLLNYIIQTCSSKEGICIPKDQGQPFK